MPTRRVLEEPVAHKATLISEATLGYMSGMIATLDGCPRISRATSATSKAR